MTQGVHKAFTERLQWNITTGDDNPLDAVPDVYDGKLGSLAARQVSAAFDQLFGGQVALERRVRCSIEPMNRLEEEVAGGSGDVAQYDRQAYRLLAWSASIENGNLYSLGGFEPRTFPPDAGFNMALIKGQRVTVAKYGDMIVRSIQAMPPDGRVAQIIAEVIQ